jgi:hypothetical protein
MEKELENLDKQLYIHVVDLNFTDAYQNIDTSVKISFDADFYVEKIAFTENGYHSIKFFDTESSRDWFNDFTTISVLQDSALFGSGFVFQKLKKFSKGTTIRITAKETEGHTNTWIQVAFIGYKVKGNQILQNSKIQKKEYYVYTTQLTNIPIDTPTDILLEISNEADFIIEKIVPKTITTRLKFKFLDSGSSYEWSNDFIKHPNFFSYYNNMFFAPKYPIKLSKGTTLRITAQTYDTTQPANNFQLSFFGYKIYY